MFTFTRTKLNGRNRSCFDFQPLLIEYLKKQLKKATCIPVGVDSVFVLTVANRYLTVYSAGDWPVIPGSMHVNELINITIKFLFQLTCKAHLEALTCCFQLPN